LNGKSFVLIRQAGDRGQLYGSVTPRDVADAMEKAGFKVDRHQINISQAIKTIGLFALPVTLHPEVKVNITVNVARSEDEAERQARGEDVLAAKTDQEEAVVAAEELFEEGAGPKAEASEEEPSEA
jgi:large subunit ribosomal protein L9